MIRKLPILIIMASIFSSSPAQELPTVQEVDLAQYAGTWYEIARLPNSFEKGMTCVTATYTLKDNGKVQVLNRGYLAEKGKYKSARGAAWVPDSDYPGRLKVSFFWPFAGNYYIMALDEDYKYALVGDPSRKYLWLLARSKTLEESIYLELMALAKSKGFDVEEVIRIDQNCE